MSYFSHCKKVIAKSNITIDPPDGIGEVTINASISGGNGESEITIVK